MLLIYYLFLSAKLYTIMELFLITMQTLNLLECLFKGLDNY